VRDRDIESKLAPLWSKFLASELTKVGAPESEETMERTAAKRGARTKRSRAANATLWAGGAASVLAVVLVTVATVAIHQDQVNEGLHAAIHRDDAAAVEASVRAGADPNYRRHTGCYARLLQFWDGVSARARHLPPPNSSAYTPTPFETLQHGRGSGILIIPRDNVRIVRALLRAGARIHDEDVNGETPFDRAAGYGSVETVQALYDAGGEVNHISQGTSPGTPLGRATRNPEMTRWLLNHGADPNLKDGARCAPLNYSCQWGLPKVVLMLLDGGAKVDSRDADGYTPLMEAAESSGAPMVRLLLQRGADPNARSHYGTTPASLCRGSNDLSFAEKQKVVALLQSAAALRRSTPSAPPPRQ
jgi:ankyrin repeat protein